MQTSSDITRQIAQVQNEVQDITRSLDRLTDIADLLGAKAELRDRTEVLDLLRVRLQKAQGQEEQQAQLDARAELEQQRDTARKEHDELTGDFETIVRELEAQVLDALDQLDRIAWQRDALSRQHVNAARELRGGTIDYTGKDELSTTYGWQAKGQDDPSGVRRSLYPLYASRHRGMPGGFDDIAVGLQMKHQADKAYDDLLNAPRPQQPDEPDTFREQLVAEFAQRRAQSGL